MAKQIITHFVKMTAAEYAALAVKDKTTLYIIIG
jgi:hypothetical protein